MYKILELIMTLIGLIFVGYLIMVLSQMWPLVIVALLLLGVIHIFTKKD